MVWVVCQGVETEKVWRICTDDRIGGAAGGASIIVPRRVSRGTALLYMFYVKVVGCVRVERVEAFAAGCRTA